MKKYEKYEKYEKIGKNEIRIIINVENFSKLEFGIKSSYFFITKRSMITETFQNYKLWRKTCQKEHQMVSQETIRKLQKKSVKESQERVELQRKECCSNFIRKIKKLNNV